MTCNYRFKRGWYCTRRRNHAGPCALHPKWWNLKGRYFVWRRVG